MIRGQLGATRPVKSSYRPDFDAGNPYTDTQRLAMETDAGANTALLAAGYSQATLDLMTNNDKLFAYRVAQNLL